MSAEDVEEGRRSKKIGLSIALFLQHTLLGSLYLICPEPPRYVA